MSTFTSSPFGCNMAELYLPFDEGMATAVQHTVDAVKSLRPDAATILDLGSGPGEPGLSLAAAFPSAAVICSDVAQVPYRLHACPCACLQHGSQAMLDVADERAKNKGLKNVSTMCLDLADLNAIPSASQDVVTANFAIISTPSLESALNETERVLKPGGIFVGTVWHEFSVPVLATDVMTELLGQPPPPPPIDPMRLADTSVLDSEFSKAGLTLTEGHNVLGKISFELGSASGDSAWMSVLISHLAKLEQMEARGDTAIRQRAKAAVERRATAKGLVNDGKLRCPGTWRGFRLVKSQ